jgi:RNA polymerase sigma-70 factor (ECF subfamily)
VRRELVEAARDGNHEAFEALAIGAADQLYVIARLILGDVDLAEDAVQDALVRAWRDLPTLREPDRFDAWMHRLIVNACADQGRTRHRLSVEVPLYRLEPVTRDNADSLEDQDQLERGFRRLRPDQRAIVVLHFYVGLAVPDIAERLGIPVGTAKSRLHYATEALRAALDADARLGRAAPNGQPA